VLSKRKPNQNPRAPVGRDGFSFADRLSWLIVSATTIFLPLFISRGGKDIFRVPKHLLLHASGIALATVALCATIIGVPFAREKRWSPPLLALIGIGLFWCSVTTLLSTNRVLSIFSLITAAAATMLFVAAHNAVQNRSVVAIYVALAPAVITAMIAIAQRTAIWNPFAMDEKEDPMRRAIALLGNPNDVGMFLVAPALAATALATAVSKHRLGAAVIAALLTCGLLASETLGAIAALSAGLLTLFLAIRPRIAVIVALAMLVLGSTALRISPEQWQKTRSKFSAATRGDLDLLVSGRLLAFRAAWQMFLKHPISGVGPGCFAYHYFDTKVALNRMGYGIQRNFLDPNFGEVHNEHLQILAEAGLPAYAIFIAALIVLARPSFRNDTAKADERFSFARRLAMPLAVALFVLALSSFPLRLAASTANILFICAATLAWSQDARS